MPTLPDIVSNTSRSNTCLILIMHGNFRQIKHQAIGTNTNQGWYWDNHVYLPMFTFICFEIKTCQQLIFENMLCFEKQSKKK